MKYGKLVVLEEYSVGKGNMYKCLCDCGKIHHATKSNVKLGKIKSCGCFAKETRHLNNRKHGMAMKGKVSSEWQTWSKMKDRCSNTKSGDYFRYGARGIKVCERWVMGDGNKNGFECFLSDMGMKPTTAHSIDRINNDGDYEPSNCRWATRKEQANNRAAKGSRNKNFFAVDTLKNSNP